MKYPRILCIFSMIVFMGVGITDVKHANAEKEAACYQAFKQTDDPAYHQRHNGNIAWHDFHDSAEAKSEKPTLTDSHWIEGDNGWQKRIMDVEGTSRLNHLTPANAAESKYQSPCPLCGKPTYFWLNTGDIDNDTESHIKADFPGWSKGDGICRNCYECYELRTGKYFGGSPAASSTDEYVIGYNRSPRVQDYFSNVK